MILCCIFCGCLCCNNKKDNDDYDELSENTGTNNTNCIELLSNCASCIGGCSIFGVWIATLVYICTDCYSIVEVNTGNYAGEYSLKCWINM
tara:strand:+ start:317 stop:589 length:273 start_codon:yes stop_codon:yes gene_type:complete